MNIAAETSDYHERLKWYVSHKDLPINWFARPEYLTLETSDISEFQDLVDRPEKERVIHVPEEDDHFVVAAKLAGALGLGSLGRIRWLKIEETPDQDSSGKPVNLREVDFFVHDFTGAWYLLGARGIDHELVEQDEHYEISVEFDNEGNRFRLINRPIEAIVDDMILENRAQELRIDQAA